jgi:pimeloyl-ACP methyl ester carboxylesterase
MQNVIVNGPFILERKGCPLHYWLAGRDNAPWIVFCHGARMNHRIFEEQLACLADHYQVLLVDLRGHGQSRPMGEDFSVETAAEDLLALFNECNIDKSVVVGHSIGGLIAQAFTMENPERTECLVLVGTLKLTTALPPFTGVMRQVIKNLALVTPDTWMQFAFGRGAGTQERTKDTAYSAAKMVSKDDFKTIFSAVVDGVKPQKGYRLPCPVLMVQSDKDLVGFGLLRILSHFWQKQEKQSSYVLIKNARHNMMQDNPEEFNQHLLNFLQDSDKLNKAEQ